MTGLLDLFEDADPAPGTLDPDVDLFDRGRAVLRTLRALAGATPVVVAIDDVQWLDAISAPLAALRAAAPRRRAGRRPGHRARRRRRRRRPMSCPRSRRRAARSGRCPLDAIVAGRADRAVGTLPRPALRAHRTSCPAATRCTPSSWPGRPMRCADRLGAATPADAARRRSPPASATCPRASLAVLRTAAALGPAPVELLDRACADAGGGDAAIHDAVDDGLLVVGDDGLVRFAHPLLASVRPRRHQPARAQGAARPPGRRRHRPRRPGPPPRPVVQRARRRRRRRARSGGRAGRRGAGPRPTAAELADHSVRVTPPADVDAASPADARRRSRYRAAAGEPERALAMADDLLGRLDAGPGRLEAITLRVFLDIDRGEEILAAAARRRRRRRRGAGPAARAARLAGRHVPRPARGRGIDAGRAGAGDRPATSGDPELEMLAAATLSTTALLAGRPAPDADGPGARARRRSTSRRGSGAGRSSSVPATACGAASSTRPAGASRRCGGAFAERGVEFQRPVPAQRPGLGRGARRATSHARDRAHRRRPRGGARRRQRPGGGVAQLPGRARLRPSRERRRRPRRRGQPAGVGRRPRPAAPALMAAPRARRRRPGRGDAAAAAAELQAALCTRRRARVPPSRLRAVPPRRHRGRRAGRRRRRRARASWPSSTPRLRRSGCRGSTPPPCAVTGLAALATGGDDAAGPAGARRPTRSTRSATGSTRPAPGC